MNSSDRLTISIRQPTLMGIAQMAKEIHPAALTEVSGGYTNRLVTTPCLYVVSAGILPAVTMLNLIATWHLGAFPSYPGTLIRRVAQLGAGMAFDRLRGRYGAYYFPAIRVHDRVADADTSQWGEAA